mgnify:CR=1 FL=1
MVFDKAYLVLFCSFLSNMTSVGMRMAMQGPMTKEMMVHFNATVAETSWPATIADTGYFLFCKYSCLVSIIYSPFNAP